MKRKLVLLISFMLLFFISVGAFADIKRVISAYAKFPKHIEPVITHTAITMVSTIDRLLNAKISVDFKDYVSAKAKIVYYLNDDESTKKTEPIADGKVIKNNQEFYISLPTFDADDESVSYQIELELKDSEGNIKYSYYPSNDIYNRAIIFNSTNTYIAANVGGKLELESGNQEYGYTTIIVPPNSFNNDVNIEIEELPIDDITEKSKMIARYKISSDTEDESLNPIITDLFYGRKTIQSTKFELKYRKDEFSEWETISTSDIDLVNRIIKTNISKFGEYAIFTTGELTDNDYRPSKRIRVKSRIQSGKYPGFEFNNLKEGDVVNIYTINGKKIRKIDSGISSGFVWNGQKDNGDWAESGTYVYQIKVKDRGKIISGTIAFVW